MADVGIRALKQNASAVVSKAAAGEAVTITDRGRPVARLVPLERSQAETLVAAGQARPPSRRLADLPAPARRRRGRRRLGEELAEMRHTDRA